MKIASIGRLAVDPASRPGFVRVTEPWSVLLEDGRWLRVPAGFWCDGASIPPLSRAWLHPLTLLALGVGHDFAVRPGALLWREGGTSEPFDPSSATALAVAFAEAAGLGRLKRWMIGAALRLTVRTYWHRRPLTWEP